MAPPPGKFIPSYGLSHADTAPSHFYFSVASHEMLIALAGPIPPVLPPSVEESYRRKCIQLKQRMMEVEEANDASRVRLDRMKRGIEKMRLERAFLLEQLAKRTSTNVEDSEGSPSPPPTVRLQRLEYLYRSFVIV
jgi:hypothetical protein